MSNDPLSSVSIDKKALHHLKPFIIFISVCSVIIGAYLYYDHQEQAKKSQIQAQLQQEQKAKQALQQRTADKFETLLNNLLADIQKTAQHYKKNRQVLTELILPKNLKKTSFIEDNYALMERLILNLNGDMDEIIARFEKADENVKLFLGAIPEDSNYGDEIRERWNKTQQDYVENYLSFFKREAVLLAQYRLIMQFIYNYRSRVTYEANTNQLRFTTPQLNAQYKALNNSLDELMSNEAKKP